MVIEKSGRLANDLEVKSVFEKTSCGHDQCRMRVAVAAIGAGIIADPVQKRLGFHQRRLRRLIDAVEKQWDSEHEDADFVAHDPYVARLMDEFDLLSAAYRLARA
jgi:hypothetical protein